MNLLETLVGPDAARQFRERVAAARAEAKAGPSAAARSRSVAGAVLPAKTALQTTRDAALAERPARSGSPALVESPALESPLGLAGLAAGDFPTSILATAAEPARPLLSGFASRTGLLAAIVFSEALAPPVALR